MRLLLVGLIGVFTFLALRVNKYPYVEIGGCSVYLGTFMIKMNLDKNNLGNVSNQDKPKQISHGLPFFV
jgi:hypothetical protein